MENSIVENCVNYNPNEIKFDPNEPLNNVMISIGSYGYDERKYDFGGRTYEADTLYRGMDAVQLANDINEDGIQRNVWTMEEGIYDFYDTHMQNTISIHIISPDNSIYTDTRHCDRYSDRDFVQYLDKSALETALHYMRDVPESVQKAIEPITDSLHSKYKNNELPSFEFKGWPEEDKIIGKVIQYNDASYEDLEHSWKEQREYLNPSFSKLVKDTVKESVNDMKESIKEKTSLVINKIKGNDGLSR